jgi:hypothetical protein
MSLKCNEFLTMAIAYLEIGRVAVIADTNFKHVDEYENAIAYQMFHAVELFYKYMIKKKTGKAPRIHKLKELEKEYQKLYPSSDYRIDHPFKFDNYQPCELNEGELELFQKHIEQFKPDFMDQHLRYPRDHRTGGYSFSLNSSSFEKMNSQFLSIATKDC